jgi:hypothetical protein
MIKLALIGIISLGKLMIPLLSVLLIFGCTNNIKKEGTGSKWQLVYQNDYNGKSLYGSVDQLISSMKKGSPIKVSWGGKEPDGRSWIEFAEPDFTTVMNDTSVVVQFPMSIIQTHYTDPNKSFLNTKRPTGWRALMTTNGLYHQFHYDLTSNEIVREMYSRTNISWYALVYENDTRKIPNLTPENSFILDSLIDREKIKNQ